ncbi:diacylglycerol O-acyltransferase 3 [Nicotiana tomentosiformis]|uniref:diacylglycerol O-acyltransferase 3 n=1 Tax=Nicotiana tomentosiformis TaxID=4098 RepID=UPI00051AC1B8|nr:diacylglycerol O-acyltransferase 3 [Nicotiana tomentosiformis]
METSTGVLRRFPSVTGAGAGVNINRFHHNSSSSKLSMLSFTEIRGSLKSKKLMVSGFKDEGYLEYYNSSGRGSSRIIRCGKKEKNKENDVALKKTKKKMKLLKGLSRDLSNLTKMGFGFGSDIGLVDQVQGKTISETAELLLGQLQQLKAEEKELKRKRKEEKALVKMKGASLVQGITNREMSSSSSSSSESSDDECQNLVDMKSLKIESLAQTIPEACERALENATSTIENHMIEPRTQNPEVDTSVEISSKSSISNEDSIEGKTSLVVPVPTILDQNEERCLEASDRYIGNVGSSPNAAVAATTTTAGTKKIEVCMGGKCKRSGAGAILEKFQQMVGIEAAVSGCKCMGKCKDGPNVRVSVSSDSCFDAFQAGDSVSVNSAPSSNNSLCIGVGLEDVSLIAANLLGRYPEVGLANAVP